MFQRVAVTAYFQQDGACGHMLVILAVIKEDGTGEPWIIAFHLVFQGGREAQILEEIGVINIFVGTAVDDHHLGRRFSVYFGHGGSDGVAGDDGVPMNIQNNFDGGVFFQVVLDGDRS